MNLNEQLALAIKLATDVHHGQYDKSGKPYILHPLHLMTQLLYDMELAVIAVLHDVLEDSKGNSNEVTGLDLIRAGFSNRVTLALSYLTHDESDSYEVYIDKLCENLDAITVKRKDLEHNSDITRLKGVTEKDLKRIEKYHKAFIKLGKARNTLKG